GGRLDREILAPVLLVPTSVVHDDPERTADAWVELDGRAARVPRTHPAGHERRVEPRGEHPLAREPQHAPHHQLVSARGTCHRAAPPRGRRAGNSRTSAAAPASAPPRAAARSGGAASARGRGRGATPARRAPAPLHASTRR